MSDSDIEIYQQLPYATFGFRVSKHWIQSQTIAESGGAATCPHFRQTLLPSERAIIEGNSSASTQYGQRCSSFMQCAQRSSTVGEATNSHPSGAIGQSMYGASFSCKPTRCVIGDSNWSLKAVLKMSRIAALHRLLLIEHLTMQITRLSD
jgi:hypothetical protein